MDRNLTDMEKLIVGITHWDGLKIVQNIINKIISGQLVIPNNATLVVAIDLFFEYDFLMSQVVLARVGSPKFMATRNVGLNTGGLYITKYIGIRILYQKQKLKISF